MKLAGILLIILGIVALVYQGFSFTETKQDAKIGPLEINHQEQHNVWIPPVIGAVCVVGGVACLVMGARGGSKM